MQNIKELSKGCYVITLPSNPENAAKDLKKAMEEIHGYYGGFQYIPLANYKNGQLKTLYAFCKEMM